MGFATVYEELKAMERRGLAHSERVGRQLVYEARWSHPMAAVLKALLTQSTLAVRGDADDDARPMAALRALGAPLGGGGSSSGGLGLEEAVVRGFQLARRNASVARVMPVVLWVQRQNVDFPRLVQMSTRVGMRRVLGFYLDLTGLLSGDAVLRSLADDLVDRRVRRRERFFTHAASGLATARLERKNTPRVARKWHYSMNMGLDNFESHFKKFTGA